MNRESLIVGRVKRRPLAVTRLLSRMVYWNGRGRHVLLALPLVLALSGCSRPNSEETEQKDAQPQGNMIEMTLEAQQHVGLKVAPARVEKLAEMLQVNGTVQPIDSQIGRVRPLASGRLHEVLAKVGDRVAAGQQLAQLDTIEAGDLRSQYLAAQADLKKLQAQHAVALKQLERSRNLVQMGATSQKELESSEAEEQALQAGVDAQDSLIRGLSTRMRRLGVDSEDATGSSMTAIRTPFSGVVVKMSASPGEVVDPTSELFQVANLSRVWVQAEVYEKDLGRVRLGQNALISVDTYPNQIFRGKVSYVGDILDPSTRTAKVRCEVANPELRLKLDMFASVKLPTNFSRSALAVPTDAIQQVNGKPVVFVRKAPAKFEVREVKTGATVDGLTEIVAGLAEKEEVVINGAFHLKSIAVGSETGEE